MSRRIRIFGFMAVAGVSSSALAGGWELQADSGGAGPVLTYDAGNPVSYRFECTATDVIVTETGVTKLMDLQTGKSVGDDAQAVMPPGAAMMALSSGKGDPNFVPAQAVKNTAGGWDLTIRLPKNDKQLKAIGKSEMMSLFTTGYTMAVAMDDASRAQWNDFMQRCKTRA